MRTLTYRSARKSGMMAVAAALLSGCTDYHDLMAPTHDCATHANVQIKSSSGTFAISGPCETVLVM